MAVLTATTGLTDELALSLLDVMTSGLAVGNLGLTNVSVNLELAEQTVDDDLEVQLAHAGDDGLAGLVVGGHRKGRVLLGELGQSQRHLVLLGLGLGLNGNVDNGLGELDLLEDDLLALGAQGVTGGGVLEADASDDVAGGSVITVDTLGSVHLEDAAESLALTVRSVDDVGAGLSTTGVNADVGELTDERVGHDLEDQAGEGLVEGRMTLDLLAGVRIGTGDGLDVERAGQVVDNSVEQLLNTLVLVGGAHEDEVELVGKDALAQSSLELLDGEVLLHEDLLHELVIKAGSSVEELLALGGNDVSELSRDLVHRLGVGHALLVGLEVPSSHGDQVDDAPEVVLGAHRDLSGHGVSVETILHGLDSVEEVSAHAVILVDEGDAGDVEGRSLTPNGLRLGLDAGNGVEDGDSAIEDAQAALDLGGEVNVARGVDDLDAVVLTVLVPEARSSSGGNGYAALLLLNHPVHGGSALMDLTDLVGLTGVVKNTLGRGGLTGIDVGHNADVTGIGKLVLRLSHVSSLP